MSCMRPHWAVQYDCWSKSMMRVCCLRSYYQCMVLGILQCHQYSGRNYDVVGGAYVQVPWIFHLIFGVEIMGTPAWFNESELRSHWILQGRWIGKWWFSGATSRGGVFDASSGGDGRYGLTVDPGWDRDEIEQNRVGEKKKQHSNTMGDLRWWVFYFRCPIFNQ